MQRMNRLVLLASFAFAPATVVLAQAPIDPSGHWSGAIHVPAYNGASPREIGIEIDVAKNAKGELAASFSQPDQSVKGLPLGNVSFDGKALSFELRANGGGVFTAKIAGPKAITGEFIATEGGFVIPFDLARTGDPQIAAAPKNAAIGKELEGTWNGTIEFEGKKERLVLNMVNQADGSAVGTVVDLDGSNVEIPIAMSQRSTSVTIEVAAVAATFTGVLNGTELAGTWNQGPLSLPVSFTRMAK
jgi:hypothetical protein